MRLSAREILHWPLEQITSLPPGEITLTFEDGSVSTNYGEILVDWLLWEVLRKYPLTPILKSMHIHDRLASSSLHLDILSTVYWKTFEAYKRDHGMLESIARLSFMAFNNLFNVISGDMGAYVTSKDMFDFVDLAAYPPLKALNDAAIPTEASISATHEAMADIIKNDPGLDNNGIVMLARSGLVKMQQTLQCVGPIGFRTDIDSNIFPVPVMTNFTSGNVFLHDHMIESRSAAKALSLTQDPLRTAEYFNRKLQLVCAYVKRLHLDDCGTTRHIEKIIHKKDLSNMDGSYYLTDSGYKAIHDTDTHLIGKRLKLRNSLLCEHTDRYGVCIRCFGELGYNVPSTAVLGQVSSTALCSRTTQHIMSTKHLDGSSSVDSIDFTPEELEYVRSVKNDISIHLAKRIAGKRVTLTLHANEASRLNDITIISNRNNLNIHNVTALSEVKISVIGKNITEEEIVTVSAGSRLAALSRELLEYLTTHPWSLTQLGEIELDLSDWDNDLPVFTLPRKHTSMAETVNIIESVIIGNGKPRKKRKGKTVDLTAKDILKPLHSYTDPEEAILNLYELITGNLSVNIAHIGVIAKAMLVRDVVNNDYGLPGPGEPLVFGKYREIMNMRSLGNKMAHEHQNDVIYDPLSYLIKDRPPSVLDPLLIR